MPTANFAQLSKPCQKLVRLCQRVNYGSILNVGVTKGEPDLGSVEVVLDLRLDVERVRRRELDLNDFALPFESSRLFTHLGCVEQGVIESITVQDGLPRRLILRQSLSLEESQ